MKNKTTIHKEEKVDIDSNTLVEDIEQWFIDRNLNNCEPTKQMLKLYEEVGEISAAMARNDMDKIKDGIGDVTVVLIGLSMQLGLNYEDCVRMAYNEIKDRKGRLVNGVFVKEKDLNQ